MARPRKIKTEAPANSLLESIKFISTILKDQGTLAETHLLLSNKTAVAFNGIMAAGCYIEEDLLACPQSKFLIQALSKCKEVYSITQLADYKLSIKSGPFKAIIPCVDPNIFMSINPDPANYPITDEFKTGLDTVGMLANDTAQQVTSASILNTGQSLIATDAHVLIEYWHGLALPANFAMPKAICEMIKIKKSLKAFGKSDTSVTFWFEDNSWIKTQLYAEQWPDIQPIFDLESNPIPLPPDFWQAVDAVTPFLAESGLLYFLPGMLSSEPQMNAGGSFELPGLPGGVTIKASQLASIKNWVSTIDFFAKGKHGNMITAFGSKCRAVIAGRK